MQGITLVSLNDYKVKLDKVEKVLEELEEKAALGDIIIVEGKRDVASLKKLGINGNIKTPNSRSLLNFIEGVEREQRNVVILTDWDNAGEELAIKMAKYLEHSSIDVDTNIRLRLKSLVKKEIKDIESIYSYVKKLESITNTNFKSY